MTEKYKFAPDEVKICAIWDNKEEKYWHTPKGKNTWRAVNHAKNAWNYNPPHNQGFERTNRWGGTEFCKFNEQNRYEVHVGTFKLVEVADSK